ncbi:SDR family NAD(P)-dependent oxidoreductase, partial [Bacillus subtilis]
MQSLQHKTALITGGGRGIGRATALALAKEGVNIGLIGRTAANVEKVAEEVKALGVKAAFAAADVKDAEQVNQAVAQVKEQLGDIDILINNAGISKFGGFLDLSADEWEN